MNTSATTIDTIDTIVRWAAELRVDLIDATGSARPNNLAADGTTTVAAAMHALRAVIDAFLDRDDPDNEITGEQSTE